MNRDQDWFLMIKEQKINYTRMTWIPLFVDEHSKQGVFPNPGYDDDYFGVGTMLVELDEEDEAKNLNWVDVRPGSHRPGFDSHGFYSAKHYFGHVNGEYLVFPVEPEGKRTPRYVLIDPDLILGLRLHPVGPDWVSSSDDGEVVLRQELDGNGSVTKVEIRSEYLKDYLAAREMGLAIVTLRERKHIFSTDPKIEFPEATISPKLNWEGWIKELDEHGDDFGSKWQVTVQGRYDVDSSEDAPIAEAFPDESKLKSEHFETVPGESKRYAVYSDLIQHDWIVPASTSPRVRDDESTESYIFVADAASTKMSSQELEDAPNHRWLTFKPESVSNLHDEKKITLGWLTRQTGYFRYIDGTSVTFGVNPRGLISIFSKDVIELSPHRQRYFSGHSVAPDGGVCDELVRAQMQCKPADTVAPESRILQVFNKLNQIFVTKFSKALFRNNAAVDAIAASTHRFKASNIEQLYDLAKDLRRLFIESIDDKFLETLTSTFPKDTGSIKRLSKLLDDAGQDGRSITGALAGINELRQASAHLPRKCVDEAFLLVGVDVKAPSVISAMNMIEAVVNAIDNIAKGLEAKS